MGFPILVRRHLYIESYPWCHHDLLTEPFINIAPQIKRTCNAPVLPSYGDDMNKVLYVKQLVLCINVMNLICVAASFRNCVDIFAMPFLDLSIQGDGSVELGHQRLLQ